MTKNQWRKPVQCLPRQRVAFERLQIVNEKKANSSEKEKIPKNARRRRDEKMREKKGPLDTKTSAEKIGKRCLLGRVLGIYARKSLEKRQEALNDAKKKKRNREKVSRGARSHTPACSQQPVLSHGCTTGRGAPLQDITSHLTKLPRAR
jgi:hypothetical protein